LRFVVDGMLGKLARWLRILGHEVDYDPGLNDSSLLDLTARKGAVLLTRDEELHNRAKARHVRALLVTSDSEEEKLADVAREYGIPLVVDMALTRCPKCGASLSYAEKAKVAHNVPASSLRLYPEFWKCTNVNCGKLYWRGSHWKKIELTLANAMKLLEVR